MERLTLRINFDTNKATIRQADVPELQKAVEFVKRYPGRTISIDGHTDNVGNAKYNQGLSERRAAAVKEYLLKNGVPGGERITTAGYGQTKPIADNATANGQFENRRVEIAVSALDTIRRAGVMAGTAWGPRRDCRARVLADPASVAPRKANPLSPSEGGRVAIERSSEEPSEG